MEPYAIRRMSEGETEQALALIATDDLRPEGILSGGSKFWGAYLADQLIGMIGCEYQGRYGLLRSAIVSKAHRGKGIGARLTQVLFDEAKAEHLDSIYLFSTESASYWIPFGFEETTVLEVVERLGGAPQVRLFDELGWLPTEQVYKRRV